MLTTLLLVPTSLERDHLARQPGFGDIIARCELVGFGPVAAAARTAQLIGRHRPDRVLLAGIAGTYDGTALDVGSATTFGRVGLYGVGVGTGADFQPGSALGFRQSPDDQHPDRDLGEELALAGPTEAHARSLITCCAASISPADVQQRLARFPGASAEDMEGFGVAIASRLMGVPVAVVRGISNEVGDRRRDRWKISEALESAWRLVSQLAASDRWETRE